jgi:hypothetical protein
MTANGGSSKRTSYHQERAIAGLLTTNTIAEAAQVGGVGTRTLERWLAEDTSFVSAYRDARKRVVEHAITRLQGTVTKAVETLEDAMDCGKPGIEVRAAAIVLDHALGAIKLYDHDERLAEIEEIVYARRQEGSLEGGWYGGVN